MPGNSARAARWYIKALRVTREILSSAWPASGRCRFLRV
jgi:hypothetical protein